ncbi:MAG: hypothetical protein XXXJIFNMEKO3_01706 [Candidatus Erwinia impunctatus]|nr:hypothetical protein XXXJIFNMEKO_01706 [Culicoides impunctatus]
MTTSIKLTVKRLYAMQDDRMISTCATVRIYARGQLIATEQIKGMTESAVYKYIHHELQPESAVSVEWECDGIADMTVVVMPECPCCQR